MPFNYSFTRVSGNAKTGPIPTTMTDRSSCPEACIFKGNGCYAETGMVRIQWQKLGGFAAPRTKGIALDALCASIKALPKGTLWRHNVAGDLPHYNQVIDNTSLLSIVESNKGKRGFTYTHHVVNGDSNTAVANKGLIRHANSLGFTINLSANTPEQADELLALNIGPVVCVMPEGSPKVQVTPAGNTIVLCPATYRDDIQCSNCGICAVPTHKAIIGFPVHGVQKGKAHKAIILVKA